MTLPFARLLLLAFVLTSCLQTFSWAQNPQEQEPANTVLEESNPPTEIPTWPNFEKAFEAGVLSYKAKKYPEALLAFQKAVEMQPSNGPALTNLALVQFQLGQIPKAVALLRKAHSLNPAFSTPRVALDFILPQLPVKEIPHEIHFLETLRATLFIPFSLTPFLGLTALTFFLVGWLFLNYWKKKKQMAEGRQISMDFPLLPSFVFILFIVCSLLTGLKLWDSQRPRGTVQVEKTTVYSAPDEKSVALLDLHGGLEVVLHHSQGAWVQVTYPGALTGWVPKDSVLQTSGSQL